MSGTINMNATNKWFGILTPERKFKRLKFKLTDVVSYMVVGHTVRTTDNTVYGHITSLFTTKHETIFPEEVHVPGSGHTGQGMFCAVAGRQSVAGDQPPPPCWP